MTRSVATAAARLRDQCGSEYVRLTRCPASGSIHSGSIRATVRANSREVSTSSAAITQRGGFRASGEPGKIMNLAPRAPRYSRRPRPPRPAAAAPVSLAQPDLGEQAGEHRDVDAVLVGRRCRSAVMPALRAAERSWACRSCHSRMRR